MGKISALILLILASYSIVSKHEKELQINISSVWYWQMNKYEHLGIQAQVLCQVWLFPSSRPVSPVLRGPEVRSSSCWQQGSMERRLLPPRSGSWRLSWCWRSGQVWISHGSYHHCPCLGWSQFYGGVFSQKNCKNIYKNILGRIQYSWFNSEAFGGHQMGHRLFHCMSHFWLWVYWSDWWWIWWPCSLGQSGESWKHEQTCIQHHLWMSRQWSGWWDCCSSSLKCNLV